MFNSSHTCTPGKFEKKVCKGLLAPSAGGGAGRELADALADGCVGAAVT